MKKNTVLPTKVKKHRISKDYSEADRYIVCKVCSSFEKTYVKRLSEI